MQLHKIIALLPAVVILLTSCGFSSSRKLVDPEDVIPAESYSFEKLTFDGIKEKDFSCLLEAEDGNLSVRPQKPQQRDIPARDMWMYPTIRDLR